MVDRLSRSFWGLAAILWLSTGIIAAPPLTITQRGYWLTVVDAAGVPSLVKVDTVVDLRSGGAPDPDPIPPVDIPPVADTPRPELDLATVTAVRDAAIAISDPNGSQAIAAVYDHIRGAFSDGLLDDATLWTALKTATDDALTITSGSVNWSPFRVKASAIITEAKQHGTLSSKAAIEKTLRSIKQGLAMSADGKPMISDAQLVQIAIKTNEAIDGN